MDIADRCRVGPAETVVQQDRYVHQVVSPNSCVVLEDRTPPSGSSAGILSLYGEEAQMATRIYVGIDVSKDRLDVAILGQNQEKPVCNVQAGIKELVQWMQELQPALIVVEATG